MSRPALEVADIRRFMLHVLPKGFHRIRHYGLLARSRTKAATLARARELIAAAKQKPGQLNFGSAGNGSGTHINGEKFRIAAGIDVVHVPYKGTPEALTDALGGRITYFFSPVSAALPYVREARLRAIADRLSMSAGMP